MVPDLYVEITRQLHCLFDRFCGEDDAADVEIALRMVLAMEGVECRPR